MGGGEFGRAARLEVAMDAPERLEVPRVEALDAEREAGDAGFAKSGESGCLHRAGVGFQRDFRTGHQWRQRAHAAEDAIDTGGGKQAGRAAAEEYGMDRTPPDIGQRTFQIEQQRVDVGGFRNALRGVRIEVAIRALFYAPRQVDVERQRRRHGKAASGKTDGGFSQVASACRPVRARPGRGARWRSSRLRRVRRRFARTAAAGNTDRSRSRFRRAACR